MGTRRTPELLDKIRTLWLAGVSVKEIGIIVGRRSSAISEAARFIGLAPRVIPNSCAPMDGRLRELWAAGLSMRQIGIEIGVTKGSVVGRIHRLKLPPRPSPIIREDPVRASSVTIASVNQVELFAPVIAASLSKGWRPENDQILRELWAHGYSAAEIARRVGTGNKDTVLRRAGVLGLPKQVQPSKGSVVAAWPSRDGEMLALIERGLGWDDIAAIMSVPRRSVIKRASVIKPEVFFIRVGMRFGQREVIAPAEPDKEGRERWMMRCVCGNESAAPCNALRSGRSVVCMSCSIKSATAKRATNHPPKPVVVPAPIARAPEPKPVVVAAPAAPAIAIIREVPSYVSAGPLPVLRKCDWVTSDCRPWTKCGGETVPGKPYCNAHCLRAYVPLRPLRDQQAA